MSYYIINVSKNGKHFFATNETSIIWKDDADKLIKDFQQRFPIQEGFSVSCKYYECSGTDYIPATQIDYNDHVGKWCKLSLTGQLCKATEVTNHGMRMHGSGIVPFHEYTLATAEQIKAWLNR